MSTSRPFAYNTGSTISGTIQLGDLAIGVDQLDYTGGVGGVRWWEGPDEDLPVSVLKEVDQVIQAKFDFEVFINQEFDDKDVADNSKVIK